MHFFRIKSGPGDEWLSRTVISSKREIFVICGEGRTLSPMGNAIKLSGRTFLAPHRGSSPKG